MKQELDFDLPVMGELGHRVEILTTELPDKEFPIAGYIEVGEVCVVCKWNRFGEPFNEEFPALVQKSSIEVYFVTPTGVVDTPTEESLASIVVNHSKKTVEVVPHKYQTTIEVGSLIEDQPKVEYKESGESGKRGLKIKKAESSGGSLMGAFVTGGGMNQLL